MEKLSNVILEKIENDYRTEKSQNYVKEKLSALVFTHNNLDVNQIMISILSIADGNIEIIDKIFESNFHGDPHDLIEILPKDILERIKMII